MTALSKQDFLTKTSFEPAFKLVVTDTQKKALLDFYQESVYEEFRASLIASGFSIEAATESVEGHKEKLTAIFNHMTKRTDEFFELVSAEDGFPSTNFSAPESKEKMIYLFESITHQTYNPAISYYTSDNNAWNEVLQAI
ncbi:MAG: hypothetical protein Q7K26_06235 [bacterium]|nr:hypothetical protein [bacterium]